MVHSSTAPSAASKEVKEMFRRKHPDVIVESTGFQERIREGLLRDRLMALLSGFFGGLAVLLATVGLYGVISYIVARRRNEIGIRMALGAERWNVIRMVMKESVKLLIIGLIAGSVLALAAGRALGTLLFGLKPHDPLTLLAGGVLLIVVVVLATVVPAWRASRVDPMIALRYD
jgi:ABC-type antimicrobial peptide transport system permease subunit